LATRPGKTEPHVRPDEEYPRPPVDDTKWTPFKIAVIVIAAMVIMLLLLVDFER